jgi:hypothetical protein
VSARCSDRHEPWGMRVTSEIRCEPPCRLTPGAAATHVVGVHNFGPVAYELSVRATCEDKLRYGADRAWAPPARAFKPKMKKAEDVLVTPLSLPHATDRATLPAIEQITVKLARQVAAGPEEQAGELVLRVSLDVA